MSTKSIKPKGMPWISPYLIVEDVEAALSFYQKAFGFKVGEGESIVRDENGVAVHAELIYQDMVMMIGKEGAYDKSMLTPKNSNTEPPMSLYVYHNSVEELHEQAKAGGAEIINPPEDTFWGDRMCRIRDLNGYLWSFATYTPEG